MNLITIIFFTLFTEVDSCDDFMSTVRKPPRATSAIPPPPSQPPANPNPSKPLKSAMKKKPSAPGRNPQVTLNKGPNAKAKVRFEFDEENLIIHKTLEGNRTYLLHWENKLPNTRCYGYVIAMAWYENQEAQPVLETYIPYYSKDRWTVTFEKFGRYVIEVTCLDDQGYPIHSGRETIEIKFRVLSNQLVVRKGSVIEFYWDKPSVDVKYQVQLGHYKPKKGKGTLAMGSEQWETESYRYTAKEEGMYEITVSFTYNGGVLSDMNSVYVTNMKPAMKFQTDDNQGSVINLANNDDILVMEENYIYWKGVKKVKKYFVQVLLHGRHVKYGFVVPASPKSNFLIFPFNMKKLGDYALFVVALTDGGTLVAWGKVYFSLVNGE